MVVNKLIGNLMETGLSEYEARAYIGLLGKSPATAYEVARTSGIPTSKVYEVMSKLEEKGMVSVLDETKTRKFVPMEPIEFIETRSKMITATLEEIKAGLYGLERESNVSLIWSIRDYGYLLDKTARMLEKAGSRVLLSIWAEELRALGPKIEDAQKRGVKVAAVHFGAPDDKPCLLYQHPIKDTIYAEKGGRGLVIVCDSAEALIGNVPTDGSVEGAYSTNKGFVNLAEDYIKHDIYVMKMVRRFDRELMKTFGAGYEKLRDVFSDEDDL